MPLLSARPARSLRPALSCFFAEVFSHAIPVRNCRRRLVVITPIALRDLATQHRNPTLRRGFRFGYKRSYKEGSKRHRSVIKERAPSLSRLLSLARVGAGVLLHILAFLRRLAALRMLISERVEIEDRSTTQITRAGKGLFGLASQR